MQTLMSCVTTISACTFQFTFSSVLVLLPNFPRGQSHLSDLCFSSISFLFRPLYPFPFSPILCGSVYTLALNPGESHQRLLGAHLLAIFRGGLANRKVETFSTGFFLHRMGQIFFSRLFINLLDLRLTRKRSPCATFT